MTVGERYIERAVRDGCEDGSQLVLGACVAGRWHCLSWGGGGGCRCELTEPSTGQHLHRLAAGVEFPGKSLLLHTEYTVDRGSRFTWGMG